MNTRNQTIALVALALVALVALLLGGVLALDDKSVPEFIVAAGAGAVGGIAGVATSSRSTDG